MSLIYVTLVDPTSVLMSNDSDKVMDNQTLKDFHLGFLNTKIGHRDTLRRFGTHGNPQLGRQTQTTYIYQVYKSQIIKPPW